MTHCRHAHYQSTADIWTKIAAAGEGTASFISDAYWLGEMVDLVAQLEENALGLSWYAMGVGSALALITAAGSLYSHTILNINHQNTDGHDAHHHEQCHEMSVEENNTHKPDQESHTTSLTLLQKAALAGDFISHTGDIAGPITFIANIASQNSLSIWQKALVQCGATLFGGVSSIANIRTCKNSMIKLNKEKISEEHGAKMNYQSV